MNDFNKTIDGGFLQSEHWQRFQQSLGRKVVKVEKEAGQALMIEHRLPLVGGYFFVPRGPIFVEDKKEQEMKDLIMGMMTAAKEYKVGWVRIEPQSLTEWKLIKRGLAGKYWLKKSKKDHQPAQTLMLNLQESEEKLLLQMKQKTRYNIRLAQKRGVEIFVFRLDKDVDNFCDLVQETAKRDRVVAHPRSYYKKMVQAIPEQALKIYFAKFQGKIIAAALVTYCGNVATYQHGASANQHRNVMAPYLLQWTAISEAKKQGYRRYDFGGLSVDEKGESQKKSWQGITKFKLGFCPQGGLVNFPGCYDIIINRNKYFLYRLLQGIKDLKRKLK